MYILRRTGVEWNKRREITPDVPLQEVFGFVCAAMGRNEGSL